MKAYQQLEVEWAKFNSLDPAGMVACASGTAALHLALEALRLPKGSEVVTGDFNMVAVPRAIALAGLTPVFVDCDERLLMDHKLVRRACERATSAIIVTHIYGRQASLDSCLGWPVPPLVVIEDLAEAHGVRPHPATDAACWSFYKNKIVAGEEGGAVWFRDPAHAKLARQLRSLGFTDDHDFQHVPRGHNYRMSNAHALEILRNWQRKVQEPYGMPEPKITWTFKNRRGIELVYDAWCPDEWKMPKRDAPWVYDFRIPGLKRFKQDAIVKMLQDGGRGIAARHGFKPMSAQEEFASCRVVNEFQNPLEMKAYKASREVIYLPMVQMKADAVEAAFKMIRSMVE